VILHLTMGLANCRKFQSEAVEWCDLSMRGYLKMRRSGCSMWGACLNSEAILAKRCMCLHECSCLGVLSWRCPLCKSQIEQAVAQSSEIMCLIMVAAWCLLCGSFIFTRCIDVGG
jgi:hypothetical protein